MALSKSEAMKNTSAELQSFINKAEPIIDRKLMNFVQGQTIRMDGSEIGYSRLNPELKPAARKWIEQTYRQIGWTVNIWDGDWHDPDITISFS